MAIKHSQTTPAPASDVSRRKFLQSVIAASAATGAAVALPGAAAASIPAAAVVATGDLAAAAAAAGAFLVFSDDEAALFSRVANRLIPPQGLMPGAGDIGLTTFVDGVLADAAHLRQPILDILQLVQAADDEVSSGEGLDAVLARIQQTHPAAFTSMLEAVYTGYYSHQDVLQALGWEHPGHEADTSETLDARLLEDVVARGPIYRHV
jgi:hypothetical protein